MYMWPTLQQEQTRGTWLIQCSKSKHATNTHLYCKYIQQSIEFVADRQALHAIKVGSLEDLHCLTLQLSKLCPAPSDRCRRRFVFQAKSHPDGPSVHKSLGIHLPVITLANTIIHLCFSTETRCVPMKEMMSMSDQSSSTLQTLSLTEAKFHTPLPPRRLAGPEHKQGLLHACIAIFCVPCPWCCSFSSFPCRLRIKRPLKVNMTFWPSYFTNFEQVSGQRTSIT